jgi:hypothetical protein
MVVPVIPALKEDEAGVWAQTCLDFCIGSRMVSPKPIH